MQKKKKKRKNKDNFVQMEVIAYLHKSSCARNTFLFFFIFSSFRSWNNHEQRWFKHQWLINLLEHFQESKMKYLYSITKVCLPVCISITFSQITKKCTNPRYQFLNRESKVHFILLKCKQILYKEILPKLLVNNSASPWLFFSGYFQESGL